MIVSVAFTLAILRPISFHLIFEIKGVIFILKKILKMGLHIYHYLIFTESIL